MAEASGAPRVVAVEEPKAELPRWNSKTGLNDMLSDLESNGSGNNSTNSSAPPSRSGSTSVTPPPPPTVGGSGHMQSPPRPNPGATCASAVDQRGIAAASAPAAKPTPTHTPVLSAPASGMGLVVPGATRPGTLTAAPAPAPAPKVSSLGKSGIKRATLGAKRITTTTPATATTLTAPGLTAAPASVPTPPLVSVSNGTSTSDQGTLEDAFAKLTSNPAATATAGATKTDGNSNSNDDDDFISFDELDKQKEIAAANAARAKAHAAKVAANARKGGGAAVPTPPQAPVLSGINAAYIESMAGSNSPTKAAPKQEESIYRPAVPASNNNNARSYTGKTSNLASCPSSTTNSSSTIAQDRFKNQKGIGSDSFNDDAQEEAARQARAKLSGNLRNSSGIGSDMFNSNDSDNDPFGTNGMVESTFFNSSAPGSSSYSRTNNWS